jgi:long-subunit acyl-CoA synthetase (AMP-forming)
MYADMQQLAAAFGAVGIREGDVVAQFADNSSRWLLADQVRASRTLLV